MNFLYYKKNISDFILNQYGLDAKDIDTNFIDNSFILLAHNTDFKEYHSVFSTYKKYNVIFVLDFTFEPYTDFKITNEFYRAAEAVGVPFNRLLMLYNNTYEMGLNSYLYKNRIVNTLSFPRWYYEYAMFLDQYPLNRMDYGDYDFTCFNFQGREHKKNTVKYIDKKELNCLSTYVNGKDFNSKSVQSINDNQTEMSLSTYYRGKVNICVETLYYKESEGWSDIICVTEKIFRNLYFKVPFTVVGNKNTLAYLRTLGFKTYDSFIDESYDYEEDEHRYKKSISTAGDLLSYWDTNQLDDILSYNYEFFSNKKNADIHFNKNIMDNFEIFSKTKNIV